MTPPAESIPQVMIGSQVGVPSWLLDNFTATLARLHVPFESEERDQEVYCGIEHYLPTALMILLAKPFFDGFLKKAGEDSYAAFRSSLAELTTKASYLKLRIFSIGKRKVARTSPFSRVISIYAHSASGTPIKFLLFDDASEDAATQLVDSMLTLLHEHHLGKHNNRLSNILASARARQLQVLFYNFDSKCWQPLELYVAPPEPQDGSAPHAPEPPLPVSD